MSKTKQEKYEIKIQQGKKLLAEIQTEREKIGALFFFGSVASGEIDINNIDELLTRNLTKDKHRKIYRNYFNLIAADLAAKKLKADDLAAKNQKKPKAEETTTIDTPTSDPETTNTTDTTDTPTSDPVEETTDTTEETAEDQMSDYDSLFKPLHEPSYAQN